jgi:peptidoglycan/xylan/chitin deacetylase (PgdA/CDA1 family)
VGEHVIWSPKRIRILAYHALVSQEQGTLPEGSSAKHAVGRESFRGQLDFMRSTGWITIAPQQIQPCGNGKACILTFDDGHQSDLVAASILRPCGYQAIFYIPWSHVGVTGYLGTEEIKALARDNFAIGSHGLTHAPFTLKPDRELRDELTESRWRLEDLIGRPVEDLAVPFGRYDRRVISMAKEAGYHRVMTSDVGIARIGETVLPRLPVTAATTLSDFRALISAGPAGIFMRRCRGALARRVQGTFDGSGRGYRSDGVRT